MTDNNRKGDEFVQALQRFHAGLPAEQQAMLDSIIGAATQDDTAGYATKWGRSEDAPTADQDDTAGYGLGGIRGIQRNESDQDADDTSGYKLKVGRTEDARMADQDDETSGYKLKVGRTEDAAGTAGTDTIDRWAKLAEWLNQADDDTSGYARAV